jgi:hypothetical protein
MIEVWHWSAAYGTHLEPGCWTAAIGSGLTRMLDRGPLSPETHRPGAETHRGRPLAFGNLSQPIRSASAEAQRRRAANL